LRLASILLFTLGLVGWCSGPLMSSGVIPIGAETELPPALPQSVAVDSQGRVYLAVAFFSRVQQYDADGTFLRGWSVEAGRGTFRLRTNEAGQLEVFVSRGDRLLTFGVDGELLASNVVGQDRTSDFNGYHAVSTRGWEVTVENPVLWPSLIRIDPAGNRKVIAHTPPHLWLMAGPLPAWIVLLASSALFLRSQRTRHRDSRHKS
jgi:hypothetical protein